MFGTVVWMFGILLLIHLCNTEEDRDTKHPTRMEMFGIAVLCFYIWYRTALPPVSRRAGWRSASVSS
jgi:hypothetical protein